MKHTRGTSGFTILELTVSIALLTVVAAIAFVSASQYFKTTYQREVNETAKEIYIAAQNHLTVADSLGALSGKTVGTPDSTTDEGKAINAGIYYYVLPPDKTLLDDKKSMLATMLPQGSIDETVRTSGSYIIRYQNNGFTTKVLDVFYANPKAGGFVGSSSYSFTNDDFATLFGSSSSYRDTGVTGDEARANYNGAIIGYYGGVDAAGGVESLAVPRLEVNNAEVLSARLTNSDAFGNSIRFEFYVTGEVSGAVSKPVIPASTDRIRRDGVNGGQRYIEAIFDSVTKEGFHFADLESSIEGKDFIPGENIKIQVFAIDTNSTKVSKSATRTVNSLFGSVSATSIAELLSIFEDLGSGGPLTSQATGNGGSPTSRVAKIANFRHLENLSNAVSLYDPTALGDKAPTAYEQAVDLSWPAFCRVVAGLAPDADDTTESLAVQIQPKTGKAPKAHTFAPISWTNGTLSYEGNGRAIRDVEIEGSGNAGLFGTVAGSASAASNISDLELVNFKVATTNGNAGELAGEVTYTDITRVFAHAETDSTEFGVTVSGTGSCGGLVGSMARGSMTGCAASVYVTGANVAGGLIGSATNNALVRYSYSGGHTNGGAYPDESRYASNVSASNTAGGLVGSFTSGTLIGCYSTCSVSATTAGRLAGSNGATTTNSYAVGDANGEPWDLTAPDGSTLSSSTFDSLVAGGKKPAAAFDSSLVTTYGGKYPFKTISEITGVGAVLNLSSASDTMLVKHLNTHYGDWPAVVTLVVNS